ncbi:hypothetical protein C6T71_30670 [Burkholderia multivorans]|nr:hypothetical protein C6T71_30670 [Burkholderia multivorans]
MKQWQRSHPELFNRRVTNQPGHDSFVCALILSIRHEQSIRSASFPRPEIRMSCVRGVMIDSIVST